MRVFLLSFCYISFIFGQSFNVGQEVQLARTYIQSFQDTFEKRFEKDVNACQMSAPGISTQLSKESGAKVTRVSLYIRNPLDTPDKWEREHLERLEKKIQFGRSVKYEEFFEVTQEGNQQYFRYIKPILMEESCLQCHGPLRNVDPKQFSTIKQEYPHDNAFEQENGDLRGIYSYKKPI